MRKIIFYITVLLPSVTMAQFVNLEEFFFGRLPGARAEALGRAYAAIDGDLSCIFFNPAGTATIEGIALNGSHASPYYYRIPM